MTTKEAQIILLESLIKFANKEYELTLSAADCFNICSLVKELKKQPVSEFNLGDVVYYVFSTKEIIKGKIVEIGLKEDTTKYTIKHCNNSGHSFTSNSPECKNVFGTEQEARESCKEWSRALKIDEIKIT